jgi:hypothetical protein
MTYMNKLLSLTDDIVINCESAILSSDAPSGYFENILYNTGYMFTDILDMIDYDTRNTEPYWYYVFYRVGDFVIRIFYREDDS